MKKNFFDEINDLDQNKIISINEIPIYLNSKNGYGLAIKGSKCVLILHGDLNDNTKYSLLMAISNNKVISYNIYENNVNGERYLDFIKNIINQYGNDYTLLMDNATIHKTKKFKSYCEETKVNILYNVRYN